MHPIRDPKEAIARKDTNDRQLLTRIRATARRVIPPGARVAVLSNGWDDLRSLEGQTAWHFPQAPDGAYTDRGLADNTQAIAHLEEIRAKGAEFLLIPATAREWLDQHAPFRRYLESRCVGPVHRGDECLVFDLHDPLTRQEYQQRRQLRDHIRLVIHGHVPPGKQVLVVSQGDELLRQVGGPRAWHFPRRPDGTHAGYPADSDEAIAHLEQLRAQGADFLLVPASALWWLNHYAAFHAYLETTQQLVVCQDDACFLFRLSREARPAVGRQGREELFDQVGDLVHRWVVPGGNVLVFSQGDPEWLQVVKVLLRQPAHFPTSSDGRFAALPRTGAEAIANLEAQRAAGAQFLLLPAPAFDWLKRHPDFTEHLRRHYRVIVDRPDACQIFGLEVPTAAQQQEAHQLLDVLRDLVRRRLPPQAQVLVVSQGEPELLQLDGRRTRHFPVDAAGAYAGYPASNEEAIAHLEAQRACGAEFLLVPRTAYWWLLHFGELRLHLEKHYRVVYRDVFDAENGPCTIFALHPFRRGALVPRPFGVNVVGSIPSEKGLGEAVRGDIHCLKAAGIPHVLHNFVEAGSANRDRTFTNFSDDNPYAINLVHLNADAVSELVCRTGEPFLQGRVNIGFWAWELTQFPHAWDASFQYFDEIWVPSSFVLDAVSRASPVPVVRMPHALREDPPVGPWDRAHFGLPAGMFVFLFVFDFHSYTERKNPLGLLRAFRKAFRPDDDVLLVLKGSHASPGDVEALQEAAAGANVRVLSDILSREELDTLIALSSCYVSLHRSEGFGLTIAEAMSLGKPVIATAYSGNLDFMTLANSFPVRYRLQEIERDLGPYPQGAVWADPDLDHAASLMRYVYEDPEAAQEVGRQAQEDIRSQLHPRVVGERMRERLVTVAGLWNLPLPPTLAGAGPSLLRAPEPWYQPDADLSDPVEPAAPPLQNADEGPRGSAPPARAPAEQEEKERHQHEQELQKLIRYFNDRWGHEFILEAGPLTPKGERVPRSHMGIRLQEPHAVLRQLKGEWQAHLRQLAQDATAGPAAGRAPSAYPFDVSRLIRLPDPRPVFVLGAPRSATTALTRALRTGAQLFGWEEGHAFSRLPFLLSATMRTWERRLKFNRAEQNGGCALGNLDIYEVLNQVILVYDRLYAQAAAQQGKSRWVDKTPTVEALIAVPLLSHIYPQARFLFLHRHPVKRIVSRQQRRTSAPVSVEAAALNWVLVMTAWGEVKKVLPPGSFQEIRQRDLTLGTAEVAAQVARLLDLTAAQTEGVRTYLAGHRPEATYSAPGAADPCLEEVDWPGVVKEWFRDVVGPTAREWGYRLIRE